MESLEESSAEKVGKYPHLYDSSRRDYKDFQKTISPRWEIVENLSVNEALCRQKWNNLRHRFTLAKERMKLRGGDADQLLRRLLFILVSNNKQSSSDLIHLRSPP